MGLAQRRASSPEDPVRPSLKAAFLLILTQLSLAPHAVAWDWPFERVQGPARNWVTYEELLNALPTRIAECDIIHTTDHVPALADIEFRRGGKVGILRVPRRGTWTRLEGFPQSNVKTDFPVIHFQSGKAGWHSRIHLSNLDNWDRVDTVEVRFDSRNRSWVDAHVITRHRLPRKDSLQDFAEIALGFLADTAIPYVEKTTNDFTCR
jgi:hypothetical protein